MLIADTHVHVYPAYQAAEALVRSYANLRACGHNPKLFHAGLFLTEREDGHFFSDLQSGRHPPSGFVVEKTRDDEALLLFHREKNIRLYLFSGHQVVTAEGIEILGLTAGQKIPSRRSAGDTLAAIRDCGALPVLSWAPGKWMFKRGDVIRSIIESQNAKPLLIGDTSMRARGLPEPDLMRRARQLGFPVIAGTDPLPFSGDENITGTYGISSTAFDPDQPVTSARMLLRDGLFIIAGRRNLLTTALYRWMKNRSAGRP